MTFYEIHSPDHELYMNLRFYSSLQSNKQIMEQYQISNVITKKYYQPEDSFNYKHSVFMKLFWYVYSMENLFIVQFFLHTLTSLPNYFYSNRNFKIIRVLQR